MLSADENRLLTEIGPGSRMGALLRRYWQPLGTVGEMNDRRTKRVRLVGENLVWHCAVRGLPPVSKVGHYKKLPVPAPI